MTCIHPVFLCGGSGTRLWPLSRSTYPKQFMELDGRTLFGDTVKRAMSLSAACDPLVLCNEEQRFLTAASLQLAGAEGRVILEPVGRNTAPAIALAALAAREDGHDPLLLVLPCDHRIEPVKAFVAAVELAVPAAEQGFLVTFGAVPTRPETGYGYIRSGAELETVPETGSQPLYHVDRFVEKPGAEAASAMLFAGGYYWNCGIFLFRASAYLEELGRFAPDVLTGCQKAYAAHQSQPDFTRVPVDIFSSVPAISIDYAVMEHTERAVVVPLSAQWSDMGSWDSYFSVTPQDNSGNAIVGDVLEKGCTNCYLHSTRRLVAALDLSDMVVVETADAVLVTRRDAAQDVKCFPAMLAEAGRVEKDEHLRVYRPWGYYERLSPPSLASSGGLAGQDRQGERFQVKRIVVKPGGELSLQLHHHRAEHWVVVSGTARVTVDERTFLLKEDESTYIPLGVKHRLENPGRMQLTIIEIQTGSYLEEDDIVRFADSYGRSETKK